MRCLIVDDDQMSRISLEALLQKVEDVEIAGICEDAMSAMEFLQTDKVDLIFLDIEMPALSGLDLVRTLDDLPLIIFVTAKREYAAEAFDFKDLVVDYLSKPVTLPRLVKAVNRAREVFDIASRPHTGRDYFFIRTDGRLVRIDYADLQYLETVGDYVRFQTLDKGYLVHSSMKRLQQRFEHPDFVKVHRSFIVNLSHIVDIEDANLLIDKKVIPISRAHRAALIKLISPI